MPENDTNPAGGNPPEDRKVVAPFQSPLWDHWELIRSMRKARKTWNQIAEVLEKEHGLKTSHKTIQNFYKRSLRIRKGGLPLGWEDPEPEPSKPAPAPAREAAGQQPPAGDQYEPDIYDQAVEALKRKEQQQQPKGITHLPPGTII